MAVAALLIFMFFLSSIDKATAQTQRRNITLGPSISTNSNSSYWASTTRLFAFGSYPIGDGFMVGIWIIGGSNNTIIWTAKGDEPPISSDSQQMFRGCEANFIKQDCGRGTEGMTWTVAVLENIYWVDDGYALVWVANEEGCKHACLDDCDCMAALFKDGRCSKQKLPLQYESKTNSTTTLIKVGRGGTVTDPTSSEVRKTTIRNEIFVAGLVLIICSFITLLSSCYLVYRHKVAVYGMIPEQSSTPAFIEEMNLRSFTYDQLARVTDNFKEELGRGSFGKVYKGFLPNGLMRTIAVKKIEKLAEREREFEAEMKTIGRTHHRNLVRLIGFCIEGSHRLLVYEYISNGALADFLFKAEAPPRLE